VPPIGERSFESFPGLVLQLRGRTGLTQRELAARLGVHVHSLQGWEAGTSYPSVASLKALIAEGLQAGGFAAGRESEEAQALWAAAVRDAPRFRTPFDGAWFEQIAAGRRAPLQRRVASAAAATPTPRTTSGDARRESWGGAPDVLGFVGREPERDILRQWASDERCREVAILGLGGIGKTLLATRVARDLASDFDYVLWRSLRDAPAPGEWLSEAIRLLAPNDSSPSETESAQVRRLLELLSDARCLLVLDNFETVLQPGGRAGDYRPGYERYGTLLRQVAEAPHRSCLLVTSREEPPEIGPLRGAHGPVRICALAGLGVQDSRALLSDKQLDGDDAAWQALIGRYGGNGLALKVVGETIRQTFDREISAFLEYAIATYGTMFGGIRHLLDAQAERLSPIELDILRRLAVEREPVSLAELARDMAPSVGRAAVIDAVDALRRRSLVERGERGAVFTLQSMVLEYVTDRLVEDVADEIARGQPVLFVQQPLVKALAKDYLRQSQERLIGEPILQRLKTDRSPAEIERQLLEFVRGWRTSPRAEPGYGPGNVVNLLRLLRGDLRAIDLSQVLIRQAYLAQVDAQDASLADAHLVDSVLAEAFEFSGYVALDADGALLAAGTVTGELGLWRVADRSPLWMVQGHTGAVYGVALSADGQLVASGGADRTVRVWDASTGRPITVLEGHPGAVRWVALSADGQLLASGGTDGTVRLWEVRGGRSSAALEAHAGGVWGVALSAGGGLLASGGGDGTVRLWETETQRLVATLEGHVGAVWNVALSGDGRFVASAGGDGTVRVWETQTGQPVATLRGHTGMVLGVALSADGSLLASGGGGGSLSLWETATGRPLATLWGHAGQLYGVALPAEGRLVASGGSDGTVRLWSAASTFEWRQVATLQGVSSAVRGVALSADGQLLVSGGADGTVRLWEVQSGRSHAILEGHTGGVWDVALSADGRWVASAGMDETVRLWDSATGTPHRTLRGHAGSVYAVAVSADGELVASGGSDGSVRLWDTESEQTRALLRGHTGAVYNVAFSSDGRLLASGGSDGRLFLWDAGTGQALATLQGHTSIVWSVGLSADGSLVLSSGEDGAVRLWDPSRGLPVAVLLGHTGTVHCLAVSADGRLVVSGGADGTVRLWEVGSARQLAILRGHTSVVRDLALSPDGRLVASGSFDGTVKLWDANSGACLRTLRPERRYERLDVTGLSGITEGQRAALLASGAIDHAAPGRVRQ
jgi:WD40 repeat protein/transcriptional regulator with XRE-family HTH domain